MVGFSTIAAVGLGVAGLASQNSGNNRAANAVESAAQTSDATARYIYDDTVRRSSFRDGLGNQALSQLGGMYGLGGQQPQQSYSPYASGMGSGSFGSGLTLPGYAGAGEDSYLGGGSSFFGGGTRGFNPAQRLPGPQDSQDVSGRLSGIPGAIPGGQNYAQSSAGQAAGQAASPFQAFYDSPDYQLAFTEGQSALEGSAAARGGLLSGNTGKALVDFGQNLANTTFGNYRNTLSNIAGMGQQANQAVTSAGQSYANQVGNNQMAVGAANANAAANNGSNIGRALGGFASGLI